MSLPVVGNTVDGRYLLTRRIAEGGMGVVFEAQHRVLHERVALKIPVTDNNLFQQTVPRLQREAQALALCRGRGVVQARDAGLCPSFGHYLVMEFLEGRTLESLLVTRGHLTPTEAVQVVVELGDILDGIHNHHVVHRDVKPSNLMLCRGDDGVERLRLIDFGACILVDRPRSLTGHGEVLGTYEYMSPEQIAAGAPTAAIDVWALAVIAYELLTGTVPFAGTGAEIASQLLSEARPQAPHLVRGDIPRALGQRVLAALSREVGARPSSARAFAQECVQALGAEGVATPAAQPSVARLFEPQLRGDERRAQQRAPFMAPVRFSQEKSMVTDGRLEDISEGGFLAMIDGALTVGATYHVRFGTPCDGRAVTEKVVVRWLRKGARRNAVGVEFVDLSASTLKDIRLYVHNMEAHRLPGRSEPPSTV